MEGKPLVARRRPAYLQGDQHARKLGYHVTPDSILVPPRHFMSLCRFDYSDPVQIKQAQAFREAEVPFIVENNAILDKVAKDWSTPGFLERRLGTKKYKAEKSDDNHFMYYGGSRGHLRGWRPPTN